MKISFSSIVKSGLLLIIICIILLTNLFLSMMSNCDKVFRDLYAQRIIHDPDLLKTECIALSYNMESRRGEKDYDQSFFYLDMLPYYKDNKAVDKVYGFDYSMVEYEGIPMEIQTAYPETYDLIRTDLQPCTWFDNCDHNDQYPAAVVSGKLFKDTKPGDIITVQGKKNIYERIDTGEFTKEIKNTGNITFRVADKVSYPYLVPKFSFRFTDKTTLQEPEHAIFDNSPVIFMLYDDKTISALEKADVNLSSNRSFVYISFNTDDTVPISEFNSFVKRHARYGSDTPTIRTIENTSDFLDKDGSTGNSFLLEILFHRTNMSLFTICYLIITITIFYIIWRNLRLKIDEFHLNSSIVSIFKKVIFMTTVSLTASVLLFITYILSRFENGIDIGLFSTNYFISIGIFMIISWISLNVISMIIPIVKYNGLKTSTVQTEETYTYNPIETYTEYEERDFEVSGGIDYPPEDDND